MTEESVSAQRESHLHTSKETKTKPTKTGSTAIAVPETTQRKPVEATEKSVTDWPLGSEQKDELTVTATKETAARTMDDFVIADAPVQSSAVTVESEDTSYESVDLAIDRHDLAVLREQEDMNQVPVYGSGRVTNGLVEDLRA